ncbi:MAG: InlB B-repeat-containing protein, partial [Oscillibacter sp.]|nr:InlB B-repeat-containing protein [Oscillibacter sp.]
MRRIRRFAALLMTVCIIVSSAPVISAAQTENAGNNRNDASLRTSVEASGTGSVGRMLADAISEEQAALRASESLGYAITNLSVTGSQIDVSCRSDKAACVMVALYEESGELVSFGSADIAPGAQIVTVDVSGDIPESFTASAFMIDPESKTPLCEKYVTNQYIRAMRELMDASVDDYNAAQVLNLDNDPDNNFMVFDEGVTRLDSSSDYSGVNYSNGVCVIQGAGAGVASLKKGDIVSFEDENGGILIVKAASVEVNGTTVTIREDADFETEDAFSAIKIDTNEIGAALDAEAALMADNGINVSANVITLTPNIKLIKFPEGDSPVSVTLSGSLGIKIDFRLYTVKDYTEMELKVKTSLKGSAEVSGKLTLDIPLTPTPVECRLFKDLLTLSLTPVFQIEASVKVKATFAITFVTGIAYDTNQKLHGVSPEVTVEGFDATAEGTLFIGFAFEPEVTLGGSETKDALFSVKMTAKAGDEFTLKPEVANGALVHPAKADGSLQHPCDWCFNGSIAFKAEASAKMKSKWKKWENFSVSLEHGIELNMPVADFYLSRKDGETGFGFGSCPNVRYRTNITVMDLDGNRLGDVRIDIRNKSTGGYVSTPSPVISSSGGLAYAYLPNGLYRLTGTYAYPGGDISGSQDVEIDDASAQVQLLIDAGSMRRVTLTFVTSSGQPLAGLTVQGTGMDKAPVTDGNGQVVYYAAASHRTLSVEDTVNDLYWSGTIDVGNADVEKTITVERRAYAILFKISDQDGNPVSDATLTAAKSDFETTVNVMGGEAACSLPNGSYLVTVTKDGVETRNTIQVQGKTETFRFTLIPARYTVTFNSNGGAENTVITDVASGQTLSRLPTATRDGYTFAGWNTAADGSGDAFTVNTPVTENITVYAQWKNNIPSDAVQYNGHSYKAYDQSMTWREAKAFCEARGGHLATVTTASEHTFVTDLAKSGTMLGYWLGATDEETEGQWKWVTGETWSYSNWDLGQPDNQAGIQDYLVIRSHYNWRWDDVSNDVVHIQDQSLASWTIIGLICE